MNAHCCVAVIFGTMVATVSVQTIPTLDQRLAAARATAANNALCTAITPFYWEIGDKDGPLIGLSAGSPTTYTADTSMLIASASKWMFGSYLVQRRTMIAGLTLLTRADLKALHMQAGYTGFNYQQCSSSQTVNQCFRATSALGVPNDNYSLVNDGSFYYNGGHYQKHAAVNLGLADKTTGDTTVPGSLAEEFASQLGADFAFTFESPVLARGVRTTPAEYAKFLRKMLNFTEAPPKGLQAGAVLGKNPVCTNPVATNSTRICLTARYAPTPAGEAWHYSNGHWIEDDPKVGDGAFSSPGALGFYPWIDASKTWYGTIAREMDISAENLAPYQESIKCGRTIRKAWLTGVAQ